jgi:hypothetical protein
MLQVGGRRDSLNESLGGEDGGEFWSQNFDRDPTIVFQVVSGWPTRR